MLILFGRDNSRLALTGIGLLSVTLLSVGCAGKSPLAFLKPKPAVTKAATANKQAGTTAPAVKPAVKPESAKPASVKPETAKPSGSVKPQAAAKTPEPQKTGPRKTEPRTPEQLAIDPLKPSDRLGPGFWIQLAVHFKAEGGEAAWKTLSRKHRVLLAGEAHAIKRVDLGKQGKFYRVLAGPYAERGPALEKCARLKRAKAACFVVNQDGRVRSSSVAGAAKTVAPKPPATEIPAAAAKPRKQIAPRNAAITATPALAKPPPRRPGKAAEKKAGTPAAKKKRAVDLPFQRRDSIPGIAK